MNYFILRDDRYNLGCMLTSLTIYVLTLEKNTSQWKRNGSTRALPLLSDIRPLKGTAYLCSFPLQVTFHWDEWVLFEPQGRNVSKSSLRAWFWSLWAGRLRLQGASRSQEHIPFGKSTLGRRAFYQEHFCTSPGTTHTQPACGIWGCLNFLGSGRTIWMGKFCEFSLTSQMNSAKLVNEYKKF